MVGSEIAILSSVHGNLGKKAATADPAGPGNAKLNELLARATEARLARLDAAITTRASAADYSSARAALLDRLDVVLSTRAPASTALSNATWTDAKAAFLDAAISADKDRIWNEAIGGHVTASTFGKILNDLNSRLPGAGTLSNHAPADVWAYAARALTDKANFGLSSSERDTIVDLAWDELLSGHATAGSAGKALADINSRVTAAVALNSDMATLLTRIPGTVQPQTGDAYARLGAPAGASHSADVAAVKADTAAIKSKTDLIPAAPASQGDAQTGPNAPAVDAADATLLRSTVGNKGDTPPATGTAANGTLSAQSYLKALWNLLRSITWSNLDAAITSRLAAASYTAPDNAGVAAIKAKTDNLPASPANESTLASMPKLRSSKSYAFGGYRNNADGTYAALTSAVTPSSNYEVVGITGKTANSHSGFVKISIAYGAGNTFVASWLVYVENQSGYNSTFDIAFPEGLPIPASEAVKIKAENITGSQSSPVDVGVNIRS